MDDDIHIAVRSAVDVQRVDILNVILEDSKSKGILEHVLNSTHKGKSILHYANDAGNADIVRTLLVSFNADPSIKSADEGLTCYQSAVENQTLSDIYHSYFLQLVTNDKLEHVKRCIKAGMDCNQQYPIDGAYLLNWACQYSKEDMVRCLLENGAEVDVIDSDGLTALHVSVKSGNEGAIKALMSHSVKSDPTIRSPHGDYQGFTAQELCQRLCPQFEHYFISSKIEESESGNSIADEHALSPDSSNLNDDLVNSAEDKMWKGKLSIMTSFSKEEPDESDDSSVVPSKSKTENMKCFEAFKTMVGLKSAANVDKNILGLCPLPKIVKTQERIENNSEVAVNSFSEILVSFQNFDEWQKTLDLVTMMLNSLSRLGFKINASMLPKLDPSKLRAYQYPLHISLIDSKSVSKPGKYTLTFEQNFCNIKCYSIEGARNGLATFVQLLSERRIESSINLGKVVYDNAVLETRAVMFDFEMWLAWKTGILYEVLLISSLLKYNTIVIPLSNDLITIFGDSIEVICQKLVETIILAERFCLQVVPYLEITSDQINQESYREKVQFFKQVLSCFNRKNRTIFGPVFSTFLCEHQDCKDYTFYTLGLNGNEDVLVFCANDVATARRIGDIANDATVCCSEPDILMEAVCRGMRLILRSDDESANRSLVARAELTKLFSCVEETSFCEGCLTVCSFATESVPLFISCLPRLLVNSEFSWNASTSRASHSSFHSIVDKLIFNQAPGFANALNVLSNVERTLMTDKETSRTIDGCGDGESGVGGTCSPILRWLEDPGVLSVDRLDPQSISQAEKDLRSIFSFIEVHLQPAQVGTPVTGTIALPYNPKLAYQTQAFLFQLRACASIALFTVKLLKSLYFAGRNPAASMTQPSKKMANGDVATGKLTSQTSPQNAAEKYFMNGPLLESVNLGVESLSLQVKSDLANRLIVAMNDLKLIAKQDLDDSAFKKYNQDAFTQILDQFVQGRHTGASQI